MELSVYEHPGNRHLVDVFINERFVGKMMVHSTDSPFGRVSRIHGWGTHNYVKLYPKQFITMGRVAYTVWN